MSLPEETRREFCTQACRAVSLATLGGALGSMLEGCGGGGSSPTSPGNVGALPVIAATAGNGGFVITIDSTSPLVAVGSAALVQTTAGYLLVAHVAADSFNAMGATCTHQNCTITGYGSQVFVCPCHGSTYDTSGHVLSGPAPRSLTLLPTQFANNVLTIT
jgi:cytochrome b6-f complex iron-sulfur subunit